MIEVKTNRLKKTWSITFIVALVAAIMIIAAFHITAYAEPEVVKEGKLGDDITFTLYSDGSLTVTGTGSTYDYQNYSDSPIFTNQHPRISRITISEGITRIGDYALPQCGASNTALFLPESITSIGKRAFYDCYFYRIDLPPTIETIDDYAFSGSVFLRSIYLPGTLKKLSPSAFWGCSDLISITAPEPSECKEYIVKDNVIFTKDMCTLVIYPCGLQATDYNVPEGVNELVNLRNDSLQTLSLPDSVTSISEYAFSGDSSLKKIELSESLSYIGPYAFKGCSSLEEICFPATLDNIYSTVLYDCSGLKKVTFYNPRCNISLNKFWSSNKPVIWGYDKSTAQDYADFNDLPFYDLDAGATEVTPVINLSQDEFIYDGAPKSPTVSVTVDGNTMDPKYYSVTGSTNTSPGKYTINVRMQNGYAGSASATYTIRYKGTPELILTPSQFEYDGNIRSPSVTVKDGDLVINHYSASGLNNSQPGEYTVTITLYGYYEGTATATYTILPAGSPLVSLSQDKFTYDGSPKSPDVSVTLGGKSLDPSKYTVTGLGETDPGTYTVTVTLNDDNEATGAATYTILPGEAPEVTLAPDTFTYDGTEKSPDVTVNAGGRKLDPSEYTITGLGKTDAGTYVVDVTVNGSNAVGSAKYTITPAKATPTVKLTKTNYTYKKGEKYRPSVTVYLDGELLNTSNYTVKYPVKTRPGNNKVSVNLTGNYTGTKTATYSIKIRKPSKFKVQFVRGTTSIIEVNWKDKQKKKELKKRYDGFEFEVYGNNKKLKRQGKLRLFSKYNKSKQFKNLKGRYYYVRIRAYKKIGGEYYYSDWSKVVKAKHHIIS